MPQLSRGVIHNHLGDSNSKNYGMSPFEMQKLSWMSLT